MAGPSIPVSSGRSGTRGRAISGAELLIPKEDGTFGTSLTAVVAANKAESAAAAAAASDSDNGYSSSASTASYSSAGSHPDNLKSYNKVASSGAARARSGRRRGHRRRGSIMPKAGAGGGPTRRVSSSTRHRHSRRPSVVPAGIARDVGDDLKTAADQAELASQNISNLKAIADTIDKKSLQPYERERLENRISELARVAADLNTRSLALSSQLNALRAAANDTAPRKRLLSKDSASTGSEASAAHASGYDSDSSTSSTRSQRAERVHMLVTSRSASSGLNLLHMLEDDSDTGAGGGRVRSLSDAETGGSVRKSFRITKYKREEISYLKSVCLCFLKPKATIAIAEALKYATEKPKRAYQLFNDADTATKILHKYNTDCGADTARQVEVSTNPRENLPIAIAVSIEEPSTAKEKQLRRLLLQQAEDGTRIFDLNTACPTGLPERYKKALNNKLNPKDHRGMGLRPSIRERLFKRVRKTPIAEMVADAYFAATKTAAPPPGEPMTPPPPPSSALSMAAAPPPPLKMPPPASTTDFAAAASGSTTPHLRKGGAGGGAGAGANP